MGRGDRIVRNHVRQPPWTLGNLAWQIVPKCGTSSCRRAFMVSARWARNAGDDIHVSWEAMPTHPGRPPDDVFYFTVVRDPLQRFLSVWRNKVVMQDKGEYPQLQGMDLPTFIRHVNSDDNNLYTADRHFCPQMAILKDTSMYDMIIRLEDLDASWKTIQRISSIPLVGLTRENVSREAVRTPPLSPECARIIYNLYEEDYDMLAFPRRSILLAAKLPTKP